MSVETELLERIFRHEAARDLFSVRVAGVHPWPLVRGGLPRVALRALGALANGPAPASGAGGDESTLGRLRRRVRGSGRACRLAASEAARRPVGGVFLLGFGPGRRREIDGIVRDPVLWPLVEALRSRSGPVLAVRLAGADEWLDGTFSRESWLPACFAAAHVRLRRLPGFRLSRRRRGALEELAADLARALGVPAAALVAWIVGEVEAVRCESLLYRAVLRRLRPRWVGLVAAGPHRAVRVAAWELGIPVVELQHGILAPGHLGYHFPGAPAVPYAPRLLLSWGSAWAEAVTLPANCEALVVGSATLSRRLRDLRGTSRSPDLGVVCLQGIESLEMLSRGRRLAERTPEREWVCAPHPGEDRGILEEWFAEAGAPANLRLADADGSTLSLLARADVQIGASSTVLLEGLALGCRTVVWSDMLFAESYARPLLEGREVAFARGVAETAAALESLGRPGDATDLFAPPVPDMVARIESALASSGEAVRRRRRLLDSAG